MNIYKSLSEIPPIKHPTALAIGLFDGIHLGHKAVLRTALKKAGAEDLDGAVLTFSISQRSHPVNKEADMRITSPSLFLRQLRNMGVTTVFNPSFSEVRELSPEEFVTKILKQTLNAKFVACGKDFRFGKGAAGDVSLLRQLGAQHDIEVVALPLVTVEEDIASSTAIRQALLEGDIERANRMLGHLYAIDFEVVHGNRIGRTIGSPTINQPYPKDYVVPKYGVYASLTYLDEKMYTSVSSIGVKPTIVGDYDPLSETYIQNYHGDLYGQKVQVSFLKYLRPELKYDTLEELRHQIQVDSDQAAALGTAYLRDM